ncbi:MAG: UDP-glucose 4-epimerase GalE [Bacteroidetes bacterium]|nr:MAG: UDP-glucose 4-epimerase GalE [Bacteroidota bacterium]MBL1145816.1 UDP-glucose 4-epimerase GalE [Bacteroidota bacterium]NOG58610.1 UDP-glucose 4-epimerase GalE [Bacteroidota bacterium]
MKILVTGGAGYIGSHTIIELLNNTHFEVVSVDNYSNSNPETYDRIRSITNRDFEVYEGDLTNLKLTQTIFRNHKIDGIIHFAALKSAPESVKNPLNYFHNNLNSLMNILLCQKNFKVPYFIFSSSCTVYGNTNDLPVREDTPLSEAESPYGSTKKMGEDILKQSFISAYQGNAIALRYFNPVGAHSSGLIGEDATSPSLNLFPIIMRVAHGFDKELKIYGSDYETKDGTCIRDFIHVSDIANAHVLAMQYLYKGNNNKAFEVFNLGSGIGYSILEVIAEFEKTMGINLNYSFTKRRNGDIVEIFADNKKALEILGWKPQKNLQDMLSSTWAWEKKKHKT